jgi:hypothetical protein
VVPSVGKTFAVDERRIVPVDRSLVVVRLSLKTSPVSSSHQTAGMSFHFPRRLRGFFFFFPGGPCISFPLREDLPAGGSRSGGSGEDVGTSGATGTGDLPAAPLVLGFLGFLAFLKKKSRYAFSSQRNFCDALCMWRLENVSSKSLFCRSACTNCSGKPLERIACEQQVPNTK